MEFKHISVLLNESIEAISINKIGIYADGTLGGGGHSFHLLSKLPDIELLGIDRDKEAIAAAKQRLSPFKDRVIFHNGN